MNDRDVELLLVNLPRPQLRPGEHQAALKANLLTAARQRPSALRVRARTWALAVCGSLVLLATSGWAAQQIYLRHFVVETQVSEPQMMSDGSYMTRATSACITTDDPAMTQQEAERRWGAMKAAIADGNYVLLDVVDSPAGPCYRYSVLLDDGESLPLGTSHPLP